MEEDVELAALADNLRFREALTWQNGDALRNALDRLVTAASGSTHRRRLETVASYWQRYCAKNETIGFFGPIGWGQLVDDGPAVVEEPGGGLLAARATRFEVWAIDALAAALAEDPGIRAWIPPRHHPARLPAGLDAAEEKVYRNCDGRPAFEAGPVELVAKLVEQGLLVWAFRVPVGPHPERELRAQLEAIGDPAARARCLEMLDRLEAARAAVTAAAGDPARSGERWTSSTKSSSLSQVAAQRRAGEMYAGSLGVLRGLPAEPEPAARAGCRRGTGPGAGAGAGRLRWYCGEVAEVGRTVIGGAVNEARAECGTSRVPLRRCGAASSRSSCRPRHGANSRRRQRRRGGRSRTAAPLDAVAG